MALLQAMMLEQAYEAPYGDIGIVLQPSQIEQYTDGRTVGYRLFVKAIRGRNMPNEIFVFQKGTVQDTFSNVASVADLADYAVGVVVDPQRPFYRMDQVDLVLRNIEMLAEVLTVLYGDVRELVWGLNANTQLSSIGELVIGNPESVSSSSSSSSTEA